MGLAMPADTVVSKRLMEHQRLARLAQCIERYPNALIALSGGLDSSVLLYVAYHILGGRALGVMAVSPAVPLWDLQQAESLRDHFSLPVRFIATDILENEDYAANSPLRCYFCKQDLYRRLSEIREREGWSAIFNGTVADDLSDYRPGLRAANESKIISPYLEANLRKQDVRDLAVLLNLPFHDRPSSPCLASRIPYGTRVTYAALKRVEAAELRLRGLGFRVVRVRAFGERARVELGDTDLRRLSEDGVRDSLVSSVLNCGFAEIDIVPYAPSGFHISATAGSS
jgi:uncharacterized protein